ncbi:MAG: ATP:corrinoid adenosyltransferase BtuR/CobO/CobP [Herbinix sp.]|jgi:cob(I)alamin adenosyltransferase|nr:ATP:corrinoid adenosyltransferase BtuR/CobO/CobP [Herbinix sp.]
MNGLIHIYEGEGKGKTTAAVGLSIRCAGNGGKVIFTQFLKDNKSSELNILKTIIPIEVVSGGEFFGFYSKMSEETKVRAKEVYSNLLETVMNKASNGDYQMLVLDEIIAAYNFNLIDQSILLTFLKNKPSNLEVVMTGRNPSEELLELADYISRIDKIKHPYDKGIKARVGIEK